MATSHSFYGGSNYGVNENYGNPINPYVNSGSISIATDVRTADQIKTTSDKLNTGAKAIEVQMTLPNVAEAIPNQHLEEINRLRILTGVDLTVHGPLIEPTGIGKERWDPSQREFAERQIWSSVERGHMLKPKGNIVVTVHASNGLPEPETRIMENGQQVATNVAIVNERTGEFSGILPRPKPNYLKNAKVSSVEEELKRLNDERWKGSLNNVSIETNRTREVLSNFDNLINKAKKEKDVDLDVEKILKIAKDPNGAKFINSLSENEKKVKENILNTLTYAEAFAKQAYIGFTEVFNQAYEVAKLEKEKNNGQANKVFSQLETFRKEIGPLFEKYNKEPHKINELVETLSKGIRFFENLESPQVYRPIKQFAMDKASETFSNIAFKAFEKFKDSAPIISIENPPAGSGISRAEDLKELIEASREKFVQKAKKELNMSNQEAIDQSKKLIGATWDVGHINMLRKFGYDDKDLVKQTEIMAPFIKHIHLSDNFGMEHTELPMGMGNVPMTEHMAVLQKQFKEKLGDIKKVVEVGDWYQHFKTTPFGETLEAFGSPIYGAKMAPYWNQSRWNTGGYFAGYGQNPDVHHTIYGAGFAGLPVELGGQIPGNRNRLSGAPLE